MAARILVIDDDEAVRDAFTLALEDTPYDVEATSSGREGLAAAGRERPDLVFLDLNMPGMDGVEVLRALAEGHPDVPVYIVTAFHSEYMDRLREAKDEGISFQIANKPLGTDQIRAIAAGMLDGPTVAE